MKTQACRNFSPCLIPCPLKFKSILILIVGDNKFRPILTASENVFLFLSVVICFYMKDLDTSV